MNVLIIRLKISLALIIIADILDIILQVFENDLNSFPFILISALWLSGVVLGIWVLISAWPKVG